MEEKLEFIDEYLERIFSKAYELVSDNKDDKTATMDIAFALYNVLELRDEKAQECIEAIKPYMSFFIRYIHAKVYYSLLAGEIIVDMKFGVSFDKKLTEQKFNDISLGYFIELLSFYIEILRLKERKELNEGYFSLVRTIYPLYKFSV